MSDYYQKHLSANRLKQVYEIASPRVKQYLQAEIDFTSSFLKSAHIVLELGSGYGRIIKSLSPHAKEFFGIDNSLDNFLFSRTELSACKNYYGAVMDAGKLAFADTTFDIVLCLQNGLSAFKINPRQLINESLRVLKPGGTALFSTYAEPFWSARLQWFEQQSHAGLLGQIDYEQTKNGVIACTDGFRSSSIILDDDDLTIDNCYVETKIVDQSSLFYILRKDASCP